MRLLLSVASKRYIYSCIMVLLPKLFLTRQKAVKCSPCNDLTTWLELAFLSFIIIEICFIDG